MFTQSQFLFLFLLICSSRYSSIMDNVEIRFVYPSYVNILSQTAFLLYPWCLNTEKNKLTELKQELTLCKKRTFWNCVFTLYALQCVAVQKQCTRWASNFACNVHIHTRWCTQSFKILGLFLDTERDYFLDALRMSTRDMFE